MAAYALADGLIGLGLVSELDEHDRLVPARVERLQRALARRPRLGEHGGILARLAAERGELADADEVGRAPELDALGALDVLGRVGDAAAAALTRVVEDRRPAVGVVGAVEQGEHRAGDEHVAAVLAGDVGVGADALLVGREERVGIVGVVGAGVRALGLDVGLDDRLDPLAVGDLDAGRERLVGRRVLLDGQLGRRVVAGR